MHPLVSAVLLPQGGSDRLMQDAQPSHHTLGRPSPCDIYCFEPGQEQALHSHDENDKINCVFEGRGTFTVGDESRELDAGWAVLCPPGEAHGGVKPSDDHLVVTVFMAPHP